MPNELIEWLFMGKTPKPEQEEKVSTKQEEKVEVQEDESNDIYYIDEYDLNDLLDKLPSEYYEDYSKWLKVSSVLKGMKRYEAFDKFSKKSSKYDKEKNDIIYNSLNYKNYMNINCIISILNKDIKFKSKKYKYIQPTMKYIDIDNDKIKCNKKTLNNSDLINERYLNIKNYIESYDCMIVKSDTGTGKTTSTAKYFNSLKNLRIISIVSRVSLGEQQVKTFSEANITLRSYKNHFDSHDNIFIQLDSILKLQYDDFSNCAVYLDEIDSLIQYLLDSTTLETKRLNIYAMLCKIIKTCKIVIGTDADISNLTFDYIYNLRTNMLYVNNPFKNYNNIVANHYKDENEIIDEMKKEIKKQTISFVCF